MRCSASSNRIISSPIFARARVSSRSSGSLRVFSPRVPCTRKSRFQLSSSWAGTWLSRETASSASPRESRRTNSVFRCTLQRSGSSSPSEGGGSLPGVVVGFRALSFMPGLLGCRHRSPDGVQGNRVRFRRALRRRGGGRGCGWPRTFAVLRLIAKSNLVGCPTGRSEGLYSRHAKAPGTRPWNHDADWRVTLQSEARGRGGFAVEKESVMKKILSLALVVVLSLALAAPVSAWSGRGGGLHGGFRGGFHHDGFHHFCCFGPAFVGGVFLGSALAYPYYAYPYPAYPVYADPVYAPAPAYKPQTQVSVAPVCYASGCYRLQGDGVP